MLQKWACTAVATNLQVLLSLPHLKAAAKHMLLRSTTAVQALASAAGVPVMKGHVQPLSQAICCLITSY
jgi:hypothetical protein